mmetsp:Transcript_112975/g.326405  ORF Transcript_112975/g.326405 Transcript_112975/m.326405 type:complete len:123 (-) Transcript_112975:585-953(-)
MFVELDPAMTQSRKLAPAKCRFAYVGSLKGRGAIGGSVGLGGFGNQYMHSDTWLGKSLKPAIGAGSAEAGSSCQLLDSAVKPRLAASGDKQFSSHASVAVQVCMGQFEDQAPQWHPCGAPPS